jgi:hypothetical protein
MVDQIMATIIFRITGELRETPSRCFDGFLSQAADVIASVYWWLLSSNILECDRDNISFLAHANKNAEKSVVAHLLTFIR